MKKEDCIFCKIAGGEIPSNTIYENSEFKVIMDIAPASKGHVLIIPKEHFKDIYEIDAITAGKLFQLATEQRTDRRSDSISFPYAFDPKI